MAPAEPPYTPDDEHVFGPALLKHRLRAGMSQAALARRSGLSVDAIAALERGRRKTPRAVTIRMLAEALQLTAAEQAALVALTTPNDIVRPAPMTGPPEPIDDLVGRASELDHIVGLLDVVDNRLVTLTGPGGVGKTRLAAAVAHRRLAGHPQELCWVSLGVVPDGRGVLRAIESHAGVLEPSGRNPLPALAYRFSGGRVLLVLDNCEHVIADVVDLCTDLLARSPGLQILSTSRESLGLPGERVFVVPPLGLPAPDWPVHRLHESAAVRLFCSRSEALSRPPDPSQLQVVAQICHRLGGLPLAIELAAARTNVFSIEQLATALDDVLGVLTSGRRTTDPRHRSLSDAISWSHDLLAPTERILFAGMSVFRGDSTLAAAHAACAFDDLVSTLEVMSRLVDQSLVIFVPKGADARYGMLEPVRQYAAARLADSGNEATTRRRHAQFYAGLAEQTNQTMIASPDARAPLDQLDDELHNFDAATIWAVQAGEHDLVTRIANATWRFCAVRGRYAEGMRWLDEALAGPVTADRTRADTYLGAGTLALLSCHYQKATRCLNNALELFTGIGDEAGRAQALQRLATVARELGDYDAAESLHRQSLALWQQADDTRAQATTLNYLSFVCWLRGDLDQAEGLAKTAFEHFRRTGDSQGTVWSLLNLGVIGRYRGRHDEAERLLLDALTASDQIGFPEGAAWALNHLGAIHRMRGNDEQAIEMLAKSLSGQMRLGDRWRAASVLDELAITRSRHEDWGRAAYLHGLAASMRADIGVPLPACESTDCGESIERARSQLSPDVFAATWSAGQDSLWRMPPAERFAQIIASTDLSPGAVPP